MKVIPYNNALDYLVESRSRRGHHFVDLAAHKGNGECSCEHFQFTLSGLLKLTGAKPSNFTRCDHIRAARNFLCDAVVAQLHRQQDENDALPKTLEPPTRALVIDDGDRITTAQLTGKAPKRPKGGGAKNIQREGAPV